MSVLKAVFFDIDGTLLDSNEAHARAYVASFKEAGLSFQYEQIRPLIGMGGDQFFPALAGMSEDSNLAKRISARKKEIFFKDYFPSIRPFPNAATLIGALRDRGLRIGIATSANQSELESFLNLIGIDQEVDFTISSDDVVRSKPAPDIISAALAKADCEPEEAIMVGDTPYDMIAALHAHVRTVALLCGGWWSRGDFTDALAIYASPADLLANLGDSPFGENRGNESKESIRVAG